MSTLWKLVGEGEARFSATGLGWHCDLFSDRMSSLRRGYPAAMRPSTWLERTSSTLSEGQLLLTLKLISSRAEEGTL